ncbi:hypothetical protein AB3N59_17210 [Leptospira sp. WS92.C1]
MKTLKYILPGMIVILFESCTMDTERCEKNCNQDLSICLLVAANSGDTNQSSVAISFLCYQLCEGCKDNCGTGTSRSSSRTSSRGGSGGGGRSSGGGSGDGGSSGGGGHGGGGHGGGGIITF